MDIDAANYNVYANVPANEECLYDAGCITGPGEPYWANDYYSWVIEVDPTAVRLAGMRCVLRCMSTAVRASPL